MPATAAALQQTCELCLIFWPKYSISAWLSYCQMGLANMLCWICDKMTQDICLGLSGAPELWSYASKSCGFAMNLWASVSNPDTAIQSHLVRHYCQMGLAHIQYRICPIETDDICRWFPGAPESGWKIIYSFFWLQNVSVASGLHCTSNSQLTNNLKLLAASFLTFGLCHLP